MDVDQGHVTDGIPVLTKEKLIIHYFGCGYTNKEILHVLKIRHQQEISNRQMNRVLRANNLRRNLESVDVDRVITAMQLELSGSGRCLGYRSMTTRLRAVHGLRVPRNSVMQILRELDPEGVVGRTAKRLSRRQYRNRGPNYLVHIDGFDKLKRWGSAVHGAICGFSRRILWLRAAASNNNPKIVASYFVKYISDIKAVPRCIRMDNGTENGQMADIQVAFRTQHHDGCAGEKSVLFGCSHSNQRIERWWRNGREQGGQFWIDYFKDLEDSGKLQLNSLHKECLQFCFMGVIQQDLYKIKQEWNQHPVRKTRTAECPAGKPDILYTIPELFGTVDYSIPVDSEDIEHIASYCQEPTRRGRDLDLDILFQNILLNSNKTMPDNHFEALDLYSWLIQFV